MDLLVEILIILLVAKVFGELVEHFGYPSIIGELIGGLIIGNTFLHLLDVSTGLERFSYIGILFLMFFAGAETNVKDLKKAGKTSFIVALAGISLPFSLAVALGLAFDYSFYTALFLGTILSATSVGITVRVLIDLGKLRSKVGMTIISAAVIDDVMAVFILSIVTSLSTTGEVAFLDIAEILAFMAFFFLLSLYVIFPLLKKALSHTYRLKTQSSLESLVIILILFYAIFAEEMYIAGITGCFLAGLLVSQTEEKNFLITDTKTIGYGFFIPMFFTYIGVAADLKQIMYAGVLGLFLIIAAILGKVVGCYLVCKLSRFDKRDALTVGVGMVPRMEVAIIVANIGLVKNIIDQSLYSTIILMAFVTTLITPPLLKLVIGDKKMATNDVP
ncbi:MAG TPA: cation:proton antiporter [Candidatus Methanofastidiosa archaeon]|nr:cation:proton antiporter [Candidatus Methanofastidiosa archaeon]